MWGGAPFGLIFKIYHDLKASVKGSFIKVIIIIAVAVAIGFAIGRYSPDIFGTNNELPTNSTKVPLEKAPNTAESEL